MTETTQYEEEWRGKLDAALAKFEELVTQPRADQTERAQEGDQS